MTQVERALIIVLFVVTVLAIMAVLGLRARIAELNGQVDDLKAENWHVKLVNSVYSDELDKLRKEYSVFKGEVGEFYLPPALPNGKTVGESQ